MANDDKPDRPKLAKSPLRQSLWQILCFALANRVLVAVVLFPSLALILRLFKIGRERTALSDQEILFFFLSPGGLVALILVGGFALGIAFAEQAGMMAIGYGACEGRRVTWLVALRWVVKKLPKILPLGSHLLGRALLLATPFLAFAGLIEVQLIIGPVCGLI